MLLTVCKISIVTKISPVVFFYDVCEVSFFTRTALNILFYFLLLNFTRPYRCCSGEDVFASRLTLYQIIGKRPEI